MPDGSATTSHEPHTAPTSAAVEILDGGSKRRGLGRLWPFLGPAFFASVAYVDPGNYATNLESGAVPRMVAFVCCDNSPRPRYLASPHYLALLVARESNAVPVLGKQDIPKGRLLLRGGEWGSIRK